MPNDFLLLPPRPGTCQDCAVAHAPGDPHNQQSLFYQLKFQMEHGRNATWSDAMAHCDEATQTAWKAELANRGVIV